MINQNYNDKRTAYQREIDGEILTKISNENKELAILLAIYLLGTDEVIITCTESQLEPKHFYNYKFGKLYEKALDINLDNRKIAPQDIDDELLTEYNIEDVDPTNYRQDILDIIELYKKRELVGGALRVVAEAGQDKPINELQDMLEKILTVSDDKYTSFRDVKLNDIYNIPQENKGLLTGLPYLDTTGVRLNNGELIAVGADTGAGKTTFVLNIIAEQIKAGGKVLFYSLEEGAVAIMKKLVSVLTGYSETVIEEGRCDKDKVAHWFKIIQENVFLVYKDGLGISELKSRAKIIHSRQKIDLICVDYWQLIGNASTVEDYVNTANGLNQLAISLDLPVIVIGQVDKNSSRMNSLDRNAFSGSKQLSNNASYIFMIQYNKEIEANVIEIVKSRKSGHYKKKVVTEQVGYSRQVKENKELTIQINSIR